MKFVPYLADLTQRLQELKKNNIRIWSTSQEKCLTNSKKRANKPTFLMPYNPAKNTKVSADASYGLGAVIVQ